MGSTTLCLVLLGCLTLHIVMAEGELGICWGRQTSHKLLPSSMIDMIAANGIRKVMLFDLDPAVTSAFVDTGIEVLVTSPNDNISHTMNTAAWVNKHIVDHIQEGVQITHLLVGNGRIVNASWFNDLIGHYESFQDAIDNNDRLNRWNKKVLVTLPQWTEVLKPGIEKPSQSDFREDLNDAVLKFLQILRKHGSPFIVNLFPHWELRQSNYPLEFGFFDGNANFSIKDGNTVYDNIFDLTFDKFFWALKNKGFGDIEMVVGQVGWPTDGDPYANVTNAKRFFDGFLNRTANKIGTPRYSGPIESFINTFIDEDSRDIALRGPTDRHYGLYNYDGTPKFEIDLTLQGRKNVTMESAQGVTRLPKVWCVFNASARGDMTDADLIWQIEKACELTDCSSMSYGGSCNNLDFYGNISYAYNMLFQVGNQIPYLCGWDDLGAIVEEDPSTDTCKFPVQVLATASSGGLGEIANIITDPGTNRFNVKAFGLVVVYSVIFVFANLFVIVVIVRKRNQY